VVDEDVTGEVVFATGDTHSGAVTRKRGVLDVRAAPLELPSPGYHGPSSGEAVEFTDTGNFFTYLEASGTGPDAALDISLRYGDGTVAWSDRLSVTDR